MVVGLGQLPIMLIGMIVHGHSDEVFAQCSNELWPNDLSFTIGFVYYELWRRNLFVSSKGCLIMSYKMNFLSSYCEKIRSV
jgi:hypothetical protein